MVIGSSGLGVSSSGTGSNAENSLMGWSVGSTST
jgi:hypothetical protein